MSRKVRVVYTCDQLYCLTKATVKPSGCMEYEYRDEFPQLEKRGWTTYGMQTFCKKHRVEKNK